MRTESKSSMERLLHQLAKHPYLSVIGMCLLLFFFGFCEKANLTIGSYIYAGVAILAVFAGLTFLGKIGKDTKENVIIFLFAAVFSGISLFHPQSDRTADAPHAGHADDRRRHHAAVRLCPVHRFLLPPA